MMGGWESINLLQNISYKIRDYKYSEEAGIINKWQKTQISNFYV